MTADFPEDCWSDCSDEALVPRRFRSFDLDAAQDELRGYPESLCSSSCDGDDSCWSSSCDCGCKCEPGCEGCGWHYEDRCEVSEEHHGRQSITGRDQNDCDSQDVNEVHHDDRGPAPQDHNLNQQRPNRNNSSRSQPDEEASEEYTLYARHRYHQRHERRSRVRNWLSRMEDPIRHVIERRRRRKREKEQQQQQRARRDLGSSPDGDEVKPEVEGVLAEGASRRQSAAGRGALRRVDKERRRMRGRKVRFAL